jgi:hypothetical protein
MVETDGDMMSSVYVVVAVRKLESVAVTVHVYTPYAALGSIVTVIVDVTPSAFAGSPGLSGSEGGPFGKNVTVTSLGRGPLLRVMKPLPPVAMASVVTCVPTPALSEAGVSVMERGTKKLAVAVKGPVMVIRVEATAQVGAQAKPVQSTK